MKKFGWGLGVFLLVLFLGQLSRNRILQGQNDFLQFYGGATLVGTGNLHSTSAMEAVHRRETGNYIPSVQFVRPDYYAVLLKPLAWLPFSSAYWLFQSINLAAILLFLYLFRQRRTLLWFAPICLPLWVCFANGQDVPLLLCLIALSVVCLRQRLDFLAGLLLALATFKPHFILLLPFVFAFHGRWRVIAGGITGLLGLYTLAAVVEGPDWLLRYPAVLSRPDIHPEPFGFLNLRGITSALNLPPLWLPLLSITCAMALLLLLWRTRRLPLENGLALALLGGILFSYHLGIHDCALLLLIAALAPSLSPLESGALALSYPLTYWLLLLDGPIPALPALCACALIGYQLRWLVKNYPFSEVSSILPASAR